MTAALPMGGQKITGMADPTISTDGATKNYVDTTTAAFFSTGDVKLTFKIVPDPGWLLFDDGTFGSGASGSSNSNNAANQALFTLLFNNITDAAAPILTSGGGATTRAAQTNASTAWAANCRMSLPKSLGRALAVAGTGAGLNSKILGGSEGAGTVALSTANLPPYTPAGTVSGTFSGSGTTTSGQFTGGNGPGPSTVLSIANGAATGVTMPVTIPSQAISAAFVGAAQGGTSTAFSIIQPTTYLNCMVKL